MFQNECRTCRSFLHVQPFCWRGPLQCWAQPRGICTIQTRSLDMAHMYAAPRYRMRVYIVQNKPPNNYNSCKTWQKCFKQPSSMTCCKTAAALFCTLGIYPDVVLSRWTLPRFKSLNASYQSHCACRSKMTPSKTVLHALEPAVVWCVMLPHILVEHLCSSSCAQTNTLWAQSPGCNTWVYT